MNRLNQETQETILKLLVEGNTIRSVERLTGVHRDTIVRLVKRIGLKCDHYMDSKLSTLMLDHIQVDELHTTVFKKEGHIPHEKKNGLIGEQYIFVAIDRETKLIPAFHVGKRDHENAVIFLHQLRDRVVNTFQLSTDQWGGYRHSVRAVFGMDVHYAQIKKMYYGDDSGRQGYNPARLQAVRINVKIGMPKREMICTSHVERQNLTMRMQMSRLNRLTNAISKKLDCLRAAVAIHMWHYNFMRVHGSLRMTPAMAAGIRTDVESWKSLTF